MGGHNLKCFEVKRIIIEVFQVYAFTKEEAKLKIQDPHTVTLVKETIKNKKTP